MVVSQKSSRRQYHCGRWPRRRWEERFFSLMRCFSPPTVHSSLSGWTSRLGWTEHFLDNPPPEFSCPYVETAAPLGGSRDPGY